MAQKKVRQKDLKKQRWAGIVAAILALAMIMSVAVGYFGQALGGQGTFFSDQPGDPEPEDYLAYYEEEVKRLEMHLEEHGPNVIVLQQLAENYHYLSLIKQIYFDDHEAVQEYEEKILSIEQSLVEMEPSNPRYRLRLINSYLEQQKKQNMLEEIAVLKDLLRDAPDPMIHISLIGVVDSIEENELVREEVEWLQQYLENRLAQDLADLEEQFYYTVLLGEYLGDPVTAKSMLEEILEQESEESELYQQALNYLNYLQAENDRDEEIIFD